MIRKVVIGGIILLFVFLSAFRALYPQSTHDLGGGYFYTDMGYDFWQYIGRKDGEVVPVQVVEHESDSRYIIAVRVVIDLYKCYDKQATKLTPEHNIALPFISRKQLQYWLIDKQKNIAYFSRNRLRIEKTMRAKNVLLLFSHDDYQNNHYLSGEENALPAEYKCIMTNDPHNNKRVSTVIDLDQT